MPNPRNIVSFQGIGYSAQTFHIDAATIVYDRNQPNGSAVVGRAVTLSAAGTVALAADGNAIVGKLLKVESDNKANVQTGGYVDLPGGVAAILTLGTKIVGDLGAAGALGYVRSVVAASATYVQAEAAEAARARGIIIDATDPTAVWVRLE